MAGPELAANTALVADVTITARPDVCPMNRYPTVGVIEGMKSQVCVMASGVTYVLKPDWPGRGVFAFRYLAPGVLGLIGQITTAPSKLAFKVADDWPLAGKTFVVDGWLGSQGLALPCASIAPGDPLNPTSQDCPSDNWLSDDNSAPGISGQLPRDTGTQAMDLHGHARFVIANAARQYDSIDASAPVHGSYVVKSQVGGCEGASAVSSVGCGFWLVLAKLGDVPVPTPTPVLTKAPTQEPTGYPIDRALTTSELALLLDAGSLKLYDTVVVDAQVTLEASGACQAPTTSKGEFAGFLVGIDPQVCIYSLSANGITPGRLALRVLGDRTLGYMGTITGPAPGVPRAYGATGGWPQDYGYFLVHGWLDTGSWYCGQSSLPAFGGPEPLFPAYDTMCHSALTTTRFVPPDPMTLDPIPAGPPRIVDFAIPADGRAVDAGPVFNVPRTSPTTGSTEGTYLVTVGHHCSEFGIDCEDYYVLARLADVVLPPVGSPTPVPTPTPTPQPPATPATPATPVVPTASSSPVVTTPGLWASGNRPLTLAELYAAWKADIFHLAGRTVIAKGPVPASAACLTPDGLTQCDYAIAGEGYWAVTFDSAGKISLVGELSSPGGRFVSTLAQISSGGAVPAGSLMVVDGYLVESLDPSCSSTPLGAGCYPRIVGSLPEDQSYYRLKLQAGAYRSADGQGERSGTRRPTRLWPVPDPDHGSRARGRGPGASRTHSGAGIRRVACFERHGRRWNEALWPVGLGKSSADHIGAHEPVGHRQARWSGGRD